MRFVIFVIDDRSHSGNAEEMAAIDAFNEMLQQKGNWVFACGIGAPDTARVIDNRGGALLEEAGSLFADKDFYSGFWIIDAESIDAARQLALQASQACNRRVEVRPFLQP